MKPAVLVCTSVGGCITSFMTTTLPYLQYTAVLVSIIAGVSAYLHRKRKG